MQPSLTPPKIELAPVGMYKFVAVRPDGTERILADWFPNLITDKGLDLWGAVDPISHAPFTAVCCVGSSNTAPTVGQTSLVNLVATKVGLTALASPTASSTAPYYWSTIAKYRFGIGVAAGNISEVGIGSTATALFSRGLIKDNLGVPTTITVLSDEILDVYYELREYFVNTADQVYNISIDGVATTVTMRLANITTAEYIDSGPDMSPMELPSYATNVPGMVYWGTFTLGPVTGLPSSAIGYDTVVKPNINPPQAVDSPLIAGYIQGNHYVDIGFRMTLDYFNALPGGGISGMLYKTTRGTFQFKFEPPIAKVYTKVLDFAVRISWARRP
jgi:hypothetical protein